MVDKGFIADLFSESYTTCKGSMAVHSHVLVYRFPPYESTLWELCVIRQGRGLSWKKNMFKFEFSPDSLRLAIPWPEDPRVQTPLHPGKIEILLTPSMGGSDDFPGFSLFRWFFRWTMVKFSGVYLMCIPEFGCKSTDRCQPKLLSKLRVHLLWSVIYHSQQWTGVYCWR